MWVARQSAQLAFLGGPGRGVRLAATAGGLDGLRGFMAGWSRGLRGDAAAYQRAVQHTSCFAPGPRTPIELPRPEEFTA